MDSENIEAAVAEDPGVGEKRKRLTKSEKKALRLEKAHDFQRQKKQKKKEQKRQERLDKIASGEIVIATKPRVEGEVLEKKGDIIRNRLKAAMGSAPRIVVDCLYDELMREGEIKSLAQQLMFGYGVNRRVEHPVHYIVTGAGPRLLEHLEKLTFSNWTIDNRPGDYMDTLKKEDIVYLSSESPNVLQTVDETKAYIIGGLVDHNRYKGLTFSRAVERGIAHAQLPIGDYIKMSTRKVLAVNHVFEILVRYLEHHDWQKAFLEVIPQRKGASAQVNGSEGDEEGESGGDGGEDADATESREKRLKPDDEQPSISTSTGDQPS